MSEEVLNRRANEILDKKQLSEMLHISERTIERWVVERRVPHIRLPQRGSRSEVRFLKSTILSWLKRTEVKPVSIYRSYANDEEDNNEES
jgi:predicted DNA-binding transcriptional regulator AlpA